MSWTFDSSRFLIESCLTHAESRLLLLNLVQESEIWTRVKSLLKLTQLFSQPYVSYTNNKFMIIFKRPMDGLPEWLLRPGAPVRDQVLRVQAHPVGGVRHTSRRAPAA